MPEKKWEFTLNHTARMLVVLRTRAGQIVSFAVVLVACLDGTDQCVNRYDTAHGMPHRDVLGKLAGLMEKEWLFHLTVNEAFSYALKDIRENYEAHIQHFIRH